MESFQEQKSKNTQYKTESDLNAWKKFCESLKESRAIETIPANELDLLLSKTGHFSNFYFLASMSGLLMSHRVKISCTWHFQTVVLKTVLLRVVVSIYGKGIKTAVFVPIAVPWFCR